MTPDHDPIFAGLNDEQRRAVESLKGPVLILAGAGSGKTRTLTHRIAHLMAQGVPGYNILAVTFTNKAAKELTERITRILSLSRESVLSPFGGEAGEGGRVGGGGSFPMSGTFHSICARILRRDIDRLGRDRSFVIYDTDDQQKLMQMVLKNLRIEPEELKPRKALGHISTWKSEAVRPHEAASRATNHTEMTVANIYDLYQKELLKANALDFDDLLLEVVRLFRECPDVLARYQSTWTFIHVDEYQDTNKPQYMIVSLLASEHRNLCAIGDPDQSIYAFRGADVRNILDFQHEYPDATSIVLEQNYRSTQQILDAADGIIAANPNRPKKKMRTNRTDGANVTLQEVMDERREAEIAVQTAVKHRAEGIPLSEQAILYRTNAQSRLFEEACLRAAVPYRILGGLKFYARAEVKDVLAYLGTILNPADTISLLRIINVPSRKIGQTTIGRLQGFCNERGLTLWQAMLHIEMVEGIAEPTKKRIASFVQLIHRAQQESLTSPVSALATWMIEKSGMEQWFRDGTDEGETRWENVLELLSVTKKYDALPPQESLISFLEEVALVSEVDKLTEGNSDALTLMTLHLCKGLEFRSVTVVGCEEGLLPHSSATFDQSQMEEERRLLYVGMTRAKDRLQLLHASSRTLWGKTQANARSRFLDDLPAAILEVKNDMQENTYGWLSKPPAKNWWQPAQSHNEFSQESSVDDASQDWSGSHEEMEAGVRILHRTLGLGTVLHRRGDLVEVRFDAGSVKKLALGIAPMKIAQSE